MLSVTSYRIQVQYRTKRGGSIIKWLDKQEAQTELQRLAKRCTEADAYYTDVNGSHRGDRFGCVWKMDRHWCWYCDSD